MRIGRELAIQGGVVLGAGLFLAMIGPYGTIASPFMERALYWTALVAFGVACAAGFQWLLGRALPESTPVWAYGAALSVLLAAPISLAVFAIGWAQGDRPPLGQLPQLYFLVWIITAGMTVLGTLIHYVRNPPGGAEEGGAADAGETFRKRLPPKLRAAELWALSAEDHYLRVHTSAGDTLILMRLSDAAAELEGAKGLRVHRSWWVAEQGVETARSEPGGRAAILLKDGAKAPVSRTYRPALREAGWL